MAKSTPRAGKRPARRSRATRKAPGGRPGSAAKGAEQAEGLLADLPVAGAEKDVTLSMAAGPGTLQAAGDIYRRAVPKHVKVVPNVSLRRTQAARVKLAPGEYFYVFDVFDGEGAFTLKAACGAVELSKHDFAADERQGDVFDFPVT